jgi:TonB family protein
VTAVVILSFSLLLILYRGSKLLRALVHTWRLRKAAIEFVPAGTLGDVLERSRRVFDIENVRVVKSALIKTPSTIGIFKPLVMLPQELAEDADAEALSAAVGHEFVHIMRRDYLLNLIYEFVLLPISFHPAAALIRRRITQTRELRCDELVAERFLHPEVYARSLVRLAGSALPLDRRAQTMVVGIADADILEVRIMSLLKRTKSSLRRNILLIAAAALLLGVPSVVAAAWAIDLNVNFAAQEPSRETKERLEKERVEQERGRVELKVRADREVEELKQKIAGETDATVKAQLEQQLKRAMEERGKTIFMFDRNGNAVFFKTREGTEADLQQRPELARAAKISMDQAIQIATSSTPGKVLECNLVGERSKDPGEATKPTRVLYHVVILSGDEANPITTHVLVDAGDGSIFKTERELPRRQENPDLLRERTSEPIKTGTLNDRALSLPRPEYPVIAMKAGASGAVTVEITVDETGHVIAAHAVSGHPLLQSAAVAAARQAIFTPTLLEGQPVKVTGAVLYTFVVQ